MQNEQKTIILKNRSNRVFHCELELQKKGMVAGWRKQHDGKTGKAEHAETEYSKHGEFLLFSGETSGPLPVEIKENAGIKAALQKRVLIEIKR